MKAVRSKMQTARQMRKLIDIETNNAIEHYETLSRYAMDYKPIIIDALNFYKTWFPLYYTIKKTIYQVKCSVGSITQ